MSEGPRGAPAPDARRAVFFTTWDNAERWHAALSAALPGWTIDPWSAAGGLPAPLKDYRAAFVWQAPAALFAACRGLRVVCSLGAGSDHVLRHLDALPAGVQVLRAADPLMADRMAQYVLAAVLAFTQHHQRYREQQAARQWQRLDPLDAAATPVGLLGLGRLGRRTAERLAAAGFPVLAWTRSPRGEEDAPPGTTVSSGPDGLRRLLSAVRVLVTLVPETTSTRALVDRDLLARLQPGALLVNPGRGGLMVESDILAALDDGRLAAATLDAFAEEPLPPDNPLWTHPRVQVTPHAAAISDPDSVATGLAADLARLDAGLSPIGRVDPQAGY